jgi:hypothetical protein
MRKLLIMLMVVLFAWTAAHTACAGGGTLIREEVRGQYRFCYYDNAGEIEVLRIHESNPCPATN